METVYLDTLDGFEFQKLCARIFEKLGWGKVDVLYTKDKGRDLIIHSLEGTIIVECKHHPNGTIGRPIVQKLHSAVISSNGSKGIVMTSGKFSMDALEHAKELSYKIPIELWDLHKILDLADKASIKILSGSESSSILCFPVSDTPGLEKKLRPTFERFQSSPRRASEIIKITPTDLLLRPQYVIKYDIVQNFSTSAGNIHRVEEYGQTLILNDQDGTVMDDFPTSFLQYAALYKVSKIPNVCKRTRNEFQMDKTTLMDTAKKIVIKKHTSDVKYMGRNNVVYQKRCVPGVRSIYIKDVKQVFFPVYSITMTALRHEYYSQLIENNNEAKLLAKDVFRCKICNKDIDKKILLCNACGKFTHTPKFFRSHGFVCKNCGKTICHNCAYWTRRFIFFKKILCEICAGQLASKKGKSKKKLK